MTTDFRSRLHGGETLLGTMLALPSPAIAEILAGIGFDWLFIDGEHGPLGTTEVLAILQAADRDTACLVRVPAADEVAIKRVLDLGAAGIVVPQVNTAEQAAAVVRYARYAPAGARGVGVARAHRYGLAFREYVETANDFVTVVVQAEHIDAVNHIEAIVAVEGIDAVLLGPYDLSASLGRMGQVDHPAVVEAIERVARVCLDAGMPLGFFGVSAEAVAPMMARGATLICAGIDTLLLAGAAAPLLEEMRRRI